MIHKKIQETFRKMPAQTCATLTTGMSRIEKSNAVEMYRTLYQQHSIYDLVRIIGGGMYIEFKGLPQKLSEQGWVLVKNDNLHTVHKNIIRPYRQIWLHETAECLLEFMLEEKDSKKKKASMMEPAEEFWIGDYYMADSGKGIDELHVADMMLIKPIGENAIAKEVWEKLSNSFSYQNKRDSASIGVISFDGREHYVKNFSLEGKIPDFHFPDLHYGEGFEDFHNQMLERIKVDSKGLILLHGEPGTGKTQYIRVLLDQLSQCGKRVLYVPPTFASQLTDPSMIDFISDWITEEASDVIILIEDAEPLLETRNGDGRSTGVSNLLNMTDGIINDMLGLMVIATFNTGLERIDQALLRPQRLIARKEFLRIDSSRAEQLAQKLNIETPAIEYPATLAEFYTVKKMQQILTHGVQEPRKSIGFSKP